MEAGVSVVSRGRCGADVCPAGSSPSWRMTLFVPGHEAGPEAGGGSEGMLLFGQQGPRGPSIAQVTMSIKHQTWPHKPCSDSLPDSSIRNQSKRRKPPVLGVLLFKCSEIYFP